MKKPIRIYIDNVKIKIYIYKNEETLTKQKQPLRLRGKVTHIQPFTRDHIFVWIEILGPQLDQFKKF